MDKFLNGLQKPTVKHFGYLFLFRLMNAFMVNTYYAPDEYWQSAEVAHNQVFGYGHLTWEWTRKYPLRSPLFAHPFMLLFNLLKMTGTDFPWLVAYSPKLLAALQAALFDFFLLKLASVYLGQIYILPALLINLTNWYSLFAFARPLQNVFEMAIFSAILYYYKLAIDKKSKQYELISRALAVVGFIGRATSIIPLAILWPYRLLSMKGTLLERFKYLMLNIATVAVMIITSIIYDTLYFQKFTWTALNFMEFNLLTNGADFYGVHDPLWYVTECIPYLLVGALPFFGLGLIRYVSDEINKKNDLHLIIVLVLFLAILSLPAHKEDRMLMPVWPILVLLTTYGLVNMKSSKFKKLLIILTLVTNVALFSFMGIHHNRAAFSIFDTLRAQSDNLKSVYLFTECHQTPYYSFLHKNIPMGFPDCSPQNQLSGTDSLKLFTDPKPYIQGIFENQNPSHIVILNHFLRNQTVAEFISLSGYKQIDEQEHALFIDSPIGNIDDISYIIMEKQ